MEFTLGQEIKGYELQERIAAGGFGAVYRAYQSTVGREVAVKVILPSLANKPDFIRRFEAEAQLIARLEHMNIVPLYDYWRDPDGAYLVMRYLRGGSLHDYIKQQGKLDIESAYNMLAQVAQGLQVAHRNQIVHRDIKPGNILLDEDRNAYLGDFGIAKDHQASESMTEPESLIGSPEYLAPEQARSESVTPQTDIYSLGVVLYEMLAGEHPFPNLEKIGVIFKHLNEPLPEITMLDAGISGDINDVIQKATAKNPQHRFKDVIELMEALRHAAQLDAAPTPTSVVELLTPREQEVLQLMIEGKTNREIADILVLTEGTIKQYNTSIYRKLKVRSKVQAIARARDLNFVIKKPEVSVTTGHLPEPQNPYKGLGAFQAADAQNFFGREKLTQKLLNHLQDEADYQRFLAVVGPSGSGKSSLVKAGLIPALWRGELPDSDNWYIIDMLPGTNPIDELEVALFQIASDKSINLREQLERDARGLIRVANMLLPDDGSELLVVIDQFEEVFTLLEDEAERLHFLQLLRTSVSETRSRVRIIVTLRADYYDRPLQYPDFGDLIRDRVVTVLPMSIEELERAVVEPANRQTLSFEDGLVSRIVSDVHYQPGALPLLQYALTELFEQRDGRKMTLQVYEQIGGTGGALANRADEIYLEQDEDGQEMIRQLFLRLVTLGEGAEDTRRRVTHAELLSIAGGETDAIHHVPTNNGENVGTVNGMSENRADLIDEIIILYADSRLLALDHDPSTRQPTVEVAHEAILREWDRLRQWLNESRDDIRQERAIARAAEDWQQHNRDTSFLLRGARLEQVEKWQEATTLIQTPLGQDFIEQSLQYRQNEQESEIERKQREKAQEQRSQVLLQALVAVFAVAAIIGGGLAIFAFTQRNDAIQAESDTAIALDIAQRSGLAFAANAALERNEIDLGIALALESVGNSEANMLPETLQVLERIENQAGPYIWRMIDGMTCGPKVSLDYRYFLFHDCQSSFSLWDMETVEELRQFTLTDRVAGQAGFSPDATRMFISTYVNNQNSYDGLEITLWDMVSWDVIANYTIDEPLLWIYYGTDSSTLATMEIAPENLDRVRETRISIGDSVSLRDAETGEIIRQYRFEGEFIQDFNLSWDGTMGVVNGWSGTEGTGVDQYRAIVFDMATGDILHTFERAPSEELNRGIPLNAYALFSADSTKLFMMGVPNYAIDIATGADYGQLELLEGHVNWFPDENFEYAIADMANNKIELFNIETAESQIFQVNKAYLTSNEHTILTRDQGRNDEFQIWNTRGRQSNIATYAVNGITKMDYSPNGQYIARVTGGWGWSPNFFSVTTILDSQTLEEIVELDTTENMPWAMDWSPDGRYLATGTASGEVILWDANTFQEIRRFSGTEPLMFVAQFTSDSRYLLGAHGSIFATRSYDVPPYISMWDVETGEEVRRYDFPIDKTPNWGIIELDLHPTENRVFVNIYLQQEEAAGEGVSYMLDLDTGELTESLSEISFGDFSPDGQYLVRTRFPDNGIIVFDAESDVLLREWSAIDTNTWASAISPDGQYLVTGSGPLASETAISLWDLETGQLIRRYFGHADQNFVLNLAFHPDGTQFVSYALDGTLRLWEMDTQSTLDWVKANRVVRDFTCPERALYRIEPLCEEEQ